MNFDQVKTGRNQLAKLAEGLRNECVETMAVLRERYLELRQCTAIAESTGKRCRSFALWDSQAQLCASHYHKRRGSELTWEEREKRESERFRPTCDCRAYPFPHRPQTGGCRWPFEPAVIHPLKAGRRRPGKLRLRKVRAILQKYGIKGGYTS
jgi:hypothetical protein